MAKKMWGGRFKKKTDPFFEQFSSSILTDYRLAKCDLIGSFLHIHVLQGAGLLSKSEFLKLKKGLLSCLGQVKKDSFPYDFSSEDIHTNIQNVLVKRLGKVALKLQTCRSRNEQVAFDTKLYCLLSGIRLQDFVSHVQKGLIRLKKRYPRLVVPGYTHLQHAQPIYFKDYLQAYVEQFGQDAWRLEDGLMRLEISLGSGALAGTPISSYIYKREIKKALKALKMPGLIGKIAPVTNSLSAVSDRDFLIEFLSVFAIMGVHISRVCEDLILWSTKEFGFIEIADEYCTGSSLMPQKKNPDALELMRGHAATLSANLVSVLMMMKGLPLSYNRDMQLDKGALFSSIELLEDELAILGDILGSLKINTNKVRQQLKDESLYATDLADFLVSSGLSFSEAHKTIGRLMRYSQESEKEIRAMSEEELRRFSKKLNKKEVLKRLDPEACVVSKKSINQS